MAPSSAVTALLALGVQSAMAQSVQPELGGEQGADQSFGLQEVVVTARKRDETLIDVPVAVTALDAEALSRYNATSFSKIAELAPQVTLEKTGGGGSGGVLTVRGIGSSSQDTGLASTVSVNIDGTQVSRGRIITSGFFDLQQVEVLKGPQALFFGKNSPAGVISLKSQGATAEWEGYARVGNEFEARERYVEGAISGPLSDTFGFRVAARASDMRGYENVSGVVATPQTDPQFPHAAVPHGDSPRTDDVSGRVTFNWHPTDRFTATLKVFGTRFTDDTGPNSSTEIVCVDRNDQPIAYDFVTGVPFVDTAGDCRPDGNRTNASLGPERAQAFPGARGGDPYLRFDAFLSSLNATYSGDIFSLSSISSYYEFSNEFFDNFEFSSPGNFFAYNKSESTDYSQELRAQIELSESLDVLVGGYYEHEEFPFRQAVLLAPLGLDAATGRYDNFGGFYESSSTTWSGFAQINYDLLRDLQLSVGARYTSQETETFGGNNYVSAIFATFGFSKAPGDNIVGSTTDSNVSPEVTLTWHPTERTTLYAAYKTGFKSGGFAQANLITPLMDADALRFKPEEAEGFEIGAKGEFFDRRLRLTSAVYRYSFDDLQVQNFDAATVSNQIRNAASARTTGLEIEAAFQAGRALELRGAFGYNDGEYTSYPNAPCYAGQPADAGCTVTAGVPSQSLSGDPLPRAPKVNVSGGFTYDWSISSGLLLSTSGDIRHSSSYETVETLNPAAHQDAYTVFNAGLRLRDQDDKWEVALLGQNLSDERYIVNAVDKPLAPSGQVAAAVSRGREVALRGTVKF